MVSGTCRQQVPEESDKGLLDALELQLQVWGAETELWTSARPHVLLNCWAVSPAPSLIHCWPPKIFSLPPSLLKWTPFSLQVAVWYNQRLEFYLRVDDHRFLGRLDLRPVCLPCPGVKAFMDTWRIHKGYWQEKMMLFRARLRLIGFASDFPCLWVEGSLPAN